MKNTNPAMDVIRQNWTGDGNWDDCLEAHFQICFTLARHDAHIPEEWNFRLGAGGVDYDDNDPDNEDGEGSLLGWELDLLMRQGHERNLIDAGHVLERYARMLKLAGEDY